MNNEELCAAWGGTIDTEEKFHEVYRTTRRYLPDSGAVPVEHMIPRRDGTFVSSLDNNTGAWPLKRQLIRESIGFYAEPTTVLRWLRTSSGMCGQYFPHMAREARADEQPGTIAYSIDTQNMKADRVVRQPIGRFLRKFCILLSDDAVQQLEQQHTAEMDTTFKLAETVDAIEEVYRTMIGDNACMRYGRDNWNLRDYHPSAVYCAPGMGVAYTTDESGRPKSRSVVWVNPKDPSDKRYVRVYGDTVLKKKLKANGYREMGLDGARIPMLRDSSFDRKGYSAETYVMPWVDPAGGMYASGVDRSMDANHVIHYQGDDMLTLIGAATRAKLQMIGIQPSDIQSQSGYLEVPTVDASTFIFTCPLSGKLTNRLDEASEWWVDANGAVVQVRSDALQKLRDTPDVHLTTLRVLREGKLRYVTLRREQQEAVAIPGMMTYYNDEPTRSAAGVAQLDATLYPPTEGHTHLYAPRTECTQMTSDAGVATYIRTTHAYRMYLEHATKIVHESRVKTLRREGFMPIAVHNGFKGLAHKDHPKMVVTNGGKRVITGVHDVTRLFDGSWEYARNVEMLRFMGMQFAVRKGTGAHPRDIRFSADVLKERFGFLVDMTDHEERERRLTHAFMRGINNQNASTAFVTEAGELVAVDYYNKPANVAQIERAAVEVLAHEGDDEWLRNKFSYHLQHTVPWAHAVVAIMTLVRERDRERMLADAEANALTVEQAQPVTGTVLSEEDLVKLLAEADEAVTTAAVGGWMRRRQVGLDASGGAVNELEQRPVTAAEEWPNAFGSGRTPVPPLEPGEQNFGPIGERVNALVQEATGIPMPPWATATNVVEGATE